MGILQICACAASAGSTFREIDKAMVIRALKMAARSSRYDFTSLQLQASHVEALFTYKIDIPRAIMNRPATDQ